MNVPISGSSPYAISLFRQIIIENIIYSEDTADTNKKEDLGMKLKRIAALLLASVMTMTTLAGCSSNDDKTDTNANSETTANTTAEEKTDDTSEAASEDKASTNGEVVTLKWIQVGTGMPSNYDAWESTLNEYLEEKIGVNIEMEIVPWGDWETRRNLITSTGEEFDILFTNQDQYTTDAALGVFMDITDMVQTVTPDLYAVLPEQYWDAVAIDGKYYAVPTYKDSSLSNYWVWDQAMLDKYDIDPTKYTSLEDMTEPLQTITDGEGKAALYLHKRGMYAIASVFDDMGIGADVLGVRYDDETRTVVNGLEDEEFLSQMDIIHQWYNSGIIGADAATTDETEGYRICCIAQGWSGAAKTTWGPKMGMDATAVQMGDTILSNSTVQGSLSAISAGCKNPEKALEFLQLVNTDSYLRDSLYYGLEGDDFEYTDDNKIHRLKTDWTMAGYTQGSFFMVSQLDTDEFNQWDEVKELNENATASVILGFNFDTSNVETELANVRAVWEKYRSEFLTGTKEPRELAVKITTEMKAVGLDELLAEAQSQLDEYYK